MDKNSFSGVFVNRILNMKKIKYIGLDMDHTLIRYNMHRFEAVVYRLVIERLITKKNYPAGITALIFEPNLAIRGLVIDSQKGNILKLSRYGAIRQSRHGTQLIDYATQRALYRSTYVDVREPGYMVIDTAFSIAFCVLYSQLVDFKDDNPQTLPDYVTLARDVLTMVDTIHGDGSLKQEISSNLGEYVIREESVVMGLKRYLRHGKKLFILTNSEYYYTQLLLDYAITPFLEPHEQWHDLFEFVITLANKPRFFYDNLKFLAIDPATGCMVNHVAPMVRGIYQGGNAKKFTDDLQLNGDEILYIGDHIYGDIVRLKKDCNWRTALVVDELGEEIAFQKKAKPTEKKLTQAMDIKIDLEKQYVQYCTLRIDEETAAYNEKIQALQHQIQGIDRMISELLEEQHAYFNPYWGRVFRAGAEESYFAYQVDRFACIYMEKLSDLFQQSPLNYFRAKRRLLAHDG